MKTNEKQRKIKIIAEIHPQHYGSINEIERMILQCKVGGANYVKLQLYDSKKLFKNDLREYLSLSKLEFKRICNYGKKMGIEIFASIFDQSKIKWCIENKITNFKIASRTVSDDLSLCKKIVKLNKKTFISLGMYNFEKKIPFNEKNITYFYCVSKYPTNLAEIKMPDFKSSIYKGFSDHTIGIAACIYAATRGAEYIEKHFSNNHSMGVDTQMGHVCSMDFDQLSNLRKLCDSITLMKSGE